jgi:PKD repeat protein
VRSNHQDSALSDALGAIVLVAVVGLGIAVAGMMILSNPSAEKIPAISSDITTINRTIYISHNGGDSIRKTDMQIVVDGVDYTNRFTSPGGTSWSAWSVGDYLSYIVPGAPTDGMPRGVTIYYLGAKSEYLIQSMGVPSAVVRPGYTTPVPTSPTPVPPLPVVADFSGTPVSGPPVLNVQFTDLSTGPVTSWEWNFGDGSPDSTVKIPPVHQYTQAGKYLVTLTVGNGSGFSTKSVDKYIIVYPSPAWYNCQWGYRKNITIQKSQVSGTQTNFPVLISLSSDSDLQTRARSDGHDILFTDSSGTVVIPHEIEKYTSASGDLVAWVKVPTVSSSANTTIYMYYGNPASSDQQNKNGVWDANYKAVWHLNEGGTGTRYDSTANANNANPRNYAGTEGTTGQITGADRLHRSPTDYLESTSNIGITGNSARTISFWVNLDDTNRNGMVGWGNNGIQQEFEVAVRETHYFLWGYGAGNDWDTAITPATGSWHYYTVAFDGTTTARWYVDGSLLGSTTAYTYATANSPVSIGYEYDGGRTTTDKTSYLKGVIDEVRISSIARSADWVATENRDQASPATFAIPGSQEMWSC